MKKALYFILILVLVSTVGLSLFACKEKTEVQILDDRFDLTSKVISFINENYYDDIDYDLADVCLAYGLVASLGNYNYINPLTDPTFSDGKGFGLLVKNTKYNEHIINTILPGSPFLKEGIDARRGDEIYAINGERVSGLDSTSFSSFISRIDGDKPTTFLLKRGEETIEVSCTKAKVTFPNCYYIDDLNGVPNEFGYICLRSFDNSTDTAGDFAKAVQSFNNDGNRALILDLRGNGGGSSTVFASIASALIGNVPVGTPLLEVQYAKEGRSAYVYATAAEFKIDTPIYVLCDGGTASASEALIGTMKAHGTLTALIGQDTVGKGVAQNGFTSNESGGKGDLIDIATDENGNEINTIYRLQVIIGKYFIFDPSVEGGKYCMHNNPFKPDIPIESDANVIDPDYGKDLFIAASIDHYNSEKNS